MIEWIDTHAHLASDAFDESLPEVLERARAAGVVQSVVIATHRADTQRAYELAQQHPCLFPTAGIHPNNLLEQQEGDLEQVLREAERPAVVALGETGLDRYWKTVPFELQEQAFFAHLERGQELKKPVVIHCRDAEQDVLRVLEQFSDRTGSPILGVMHSFVGGVEMAEKCMALGLMISFAGMVTFKKNQFLREVAGAIPLDRLLVETDSPYLSPEPHRGKPNEPARVVHTGECLARIRKMSVRELAAVTTANARRLFRL